MDCLQLPTGSVLWQADVPPAHLQWWPLRYLLLRWTCYYSVMLGKTFVWRWQELFFCYVLIFLCFSTRHDYGSTWATSIQFTVWKLASWSFLKKMWIFEICFNVLPELKTIFKGFSSKQQQQAVSVIQRLLTHCLQCLFGASYYETWDGVDSCETSSQRKKQTGYHCIFMEKMLYLFVTIYWALSQHYT